MNELAALAQVYLLQEYSPKEWIYCDPETFRFFKAYTERQKKVEISKKPVEEAPKKPIEASLPKKPIEEAPKKPIEASLPIKPVEEAPKKQIEAIVPIKQTVIEEPKPAKFSLEPLGSAKAVNLADIHQAVKENFEQVKIMAKPAQKVASVIVIATKETGEELLFLHNVTSAIDRLLLPAELVTVKSEEELQALPQRKGVRWIVTFGAIPVKPAESISLIQQPAAATLLRDPQAKTALWKLLKAKLV